MVELSAPWYGIIENITKSVKYCFIVETLQITDSRSIQVVSWFICVVYLYIWDIGHIIESDRLEIMVIENKPREYYVLFI